MEIVSANIFAKSEVLYICILFGICHSVVIYFYLFTVRNRGKVMKMGLLK